MSWDNIGLDEFQITDKGRRAFIHFLFKGEFPEEVENNGSALMLYAMISNGYVERFVEEEKFELAQIWQAITDTIISVGRKDNWGESFIHYEE